HGTGRTMRLLKVEGDRYQFGISPAEKTVLLALLERYPLIPLSYHKLSKKPSHERERDENQALLEEAMASRRSLLKRRVTQMIQSEGRFQQVQDHWVVTFAREEIEWLLQVLNDVRVGNWILLGCPDPEDQTNTPTREEKLAAAEMDLAAHFECMLLEAVDGHIR
ncbi:MAG: hypothetical protein N3G20_06245, partial [Verrucomicrobiae bacterium]|nr:hypothetical protein [Verrucomicrobiae bacterium]